MASTRITRTVATLYADLLQQVETAPPAGSIYQRARDKINYHYAKIPVGSTRVDRFIGRVGDPEADSQAEALAAGMELAKSRRRAVSMLKRAGLAGPDKTAGAILDAMAQAELFRNGAVVVGTAAYMMSEALAGERLPAPTLMTGDLDLATVNVALAAQSAESLQDILKRADPSFEPVLQIDPRQPPVRFRNSDGYLVDLLIQTRRRGQRPVPLPKLAAAAEPLQHLGWLIESPIPAVALSGAGVLVSIPQPARFAVHKLLVAQRRGQDRLKRTKDLAQADALMTALGKTDPFAIEDAVEDARSKGPSWAKAIDRSLAELEGSAAE